MKCHFLRAGALAVAALSLSTACNDTVTTPDAALSKPALAQAPYASGSAADRELYQVLLAPTGTSTTRGVVKIEIAGGYLVVTAHAEGLDPLQHIPQHIHANATCATPGSPIINLDANLNLPGAEAPPTGDNFPVANGAGVVDYQASRSLSSLLTAVNSAYQLNLASVDELVEWLDLANRNVHMHASAAPFTPMTCGPVERLN